MIAKCDRECVDKQMIIMCDECMFELRLPSPDQVGGYTIPNVARLLTNVGWV